MKVEAIPIPDLARAEARLPRWMFAWAGLSVLVALIIGQGRISGSLALGAAIGILNYYWLHEAVAAVFIAERARLPWLLVIKFVIRYPIAFGLVYFFYRTGWLPFMWIMAGLFVPVAGVLTESIHQICQGFHQAQE